MLWRMILVVFVMAFSVSETFADSCGSRGIALQVLGSGGPELQDKRASSGYLIWRDGQAKVLIDCGGGSALHFGQSHAQMKDLDVVLFTHFHVDHSADFAVLVKSSFLKTALAPCLFSVRHEAACSPVPRNLLRASLKRKRASTVT